MRVAVTSIACEKLAKENVAIPNGWNFYTMQDRVRVNEWNPDVEICLGWFCSGWTDWQAHKANFGDTKKIIIQWVGTDILTIKQSYELGHKMIVKWLDDHRFLHVVPARESFKELEWTGLKLYGPMDVPAEKVMGLQPMPDRIRLAIYMPPDRQDFYGIQLLKDVLPKFREEADVVFYHWTQCTTPIDYPRSHEEHFALTRAEYEEKILRGCSALIRVPVHDAVSISVGEFLMAGKPVVVNQDIPEWKHGIRSKLYSESHGDFKLTEGAAQKLEGEIRKVIDLIKNAKEPVSEKTMIHYRKAYDPKSYAERLSEYTMDQWGVSLV